MSNPEQRGCTLSEIQQLREEWQIAERLDRIAHEHKMRQLLGDDVYDFMRGGSSLSP